MRQNEESNVEENLEQQVVTGPPEVTGDPIEIKVPDDVGDDMEFDLDKEETDDVGEIEEEASDNEAKDETYTPPQSSKKNQGLRNR